MATTEVHKITWREVTGCKFNRALHPMMADRYYIHSSLRRTGDTEKTMFEIEYDRDYLVGWMATRVCSPLQTLGKEEILKLVDEAYDQLNYHRLNY